MSKKKIAILLRQALLYGAPMERELYEYELEEHIDDWYQGLLDDQNDFVFAVTENSGHVAMVLITPDKTIYVNEDARDYLSNSWSKAYQSNIQRLIPGMVDNLAQNQLAIHGVSIAPAR